MKSNPIKDDTIIKLAKEIIKPEQVWNGTHHSMLIWKLFRHLGFLPDATSEEIQMCGKQWEALYNNGRLGYSSNLAKGLADAGVCKASQSEAVVAEYK